MNKRVKSNSVRIIAGQWRGSKLSVADREGLRPTTDRVRETLFNWLMPDITNSNVLDLYAGTGVLGLEAVSRGAASVVFVEKDKQVAQLLEDNIERLNARHQCQVFKQSALDYLDNTVVALVDLVFIDPPFKENLIEPTLQKLVNGGWLKEGALVYIEYPSKQDELKIPENWQLHRQGKAGESSYCLYRVYH